MRPLVIAIGLIFGLVAGLNAFEIEEDKVFEGIEGGPELKILSTTDANIFSPLVLAYQKRNPQVTVRYTVTSTQQLYQAIREENAPYDVLVSSAMDLQMKLANDGFALAHRSAATAALPPWAHWRDQLFAFAQEPVVLVLSKSGLGDLAGPQTRDDLIRLMRDNPDSFTGRIGTYDPNRSGAGYLFATQDARQSDTYWRMSEVMGRLNPRLYTSTGAMIDDIQSGRLLMAYNVLGSYAAARLPTWPDGEIVEFQDYTNVLLRTAIVPTTAPAPELGRGFVDFLLSEQGQRLIESETGLPRIDEAALSTQPHLRPIRLDPGLLVYVDPLKRRKFLNEWSAAVVQP